MDSGFQASEAMKQSRVGALLDRGLRAAEWVSMVLAYVFLLAMMVLTTANAIGRYVFTSPITGVTEVTTLYLMGGAIWFAMSHTQAMGGHVAIDLFMRRAPLKIQFWTRVCTHLLSIIPVGLICWGTTEKLQETWGHTMVGEIPFPVSPSWAIIAVGSGVLAIRLMFELLADLVNEFGEKITD